MGEVIQFRRPEPPDPDGTPDFVIAYYWDKIKRGIPEDEAAELTALFWRTMDAGN